MPKQNTSPADYPQAVLQQIQLLAQNIAIARKRRGETQGQWAHKLGVSQPTMARIERGDPSVAMASYVMCMWLINQADGLADLIAPQSDHAALEREVLKTRPRSKAPSPAPEAVPDAHAKPAAKRKAMQRSGTSGIPPQAAGPGLRASAPRPGGVQPKPKAKARAQPSKPAGAQGIQQRILASAAKGNATAQGLAALLLQPRSKAS